MAFLEDKLKNFSRINKLFGTANAYVVRPGRDLLDSYQFLLHQVCIPSKLRKVTQRDPFTYDFKKDLMPVTLGARASESQSTKKRDGNCEGERESRLRTLRVHAVQSV